MMGGHQKVLGIITVCVVALLPGKLSAQDDGIQSEKLQVAVVGLEPFAMKAVDGNREGISIDLWLHSGDL